VAGAARAPLRPSRAKTYTVCFASCAQRSSAVSAVPWVPFERRLTIARPPRPILSRDLIARTALALVDRHGAEGASIRRVAQKLNVNPTSLYNHVPDRAAMIEDVRALVSARIDSAPLRERPWEEGLVAWARSYRKRDQTEGCAQSGAWTRPSR